MIERVLERTRSDAFRRYVTDLLIELCAIDTTPRHDPTEMRRAEAAVFDVLERELARFAFPGARAERRPIDPTIQHHPHYPSLPLTKAPARPE